MADNSFLERAFSRRGPKVWSGFSRPLVHNWSGLALGRRFNKRGLGGMIRHSEAGMLYRWARALPAESLILEIGCYGGLSTSILLTGLRDGLGGMVCSIDPFDSDLETQRARSDNTVAVEAKPSKVKVAETLRGLGFAESSFQLIEGYSQEIAAQWDRPLDFLWIDGNHDQAWDDYQHYCHWLKSGARVAVHDAHPRYGYESVARDVKKIFADERAWCELEQVKSIISGRLTSLQDAR